MAPHALDPARRIETGRLVLANWRTMLAHAGPRLALENELEAMLTPAITQRLPPEMGYPGSYASMAAWIADRDAEAEIWSAHARADGRLIGLGILFFEVEDEAAEMPVIMIGYFIGEHEWGQGFGKELVGGLVAAIAEHAPVRISAKVEGDNTVSARLLERLGFVASADLSTQDLLHFDKICT